MEWSVKKTVINLRLVLEQSIKVQLVSLLNCYNKSYKCMDQALATSYVTNAITNRSAARFRNARVAFLLNLVTRLNVNRSVAIPNFIKGYMGSMIFKYYFRFFFNEYGIIYVWNLQIHDLFLSLLICECVFLCLLLTSTCKQRIFM